MNNQGKPNQQLLDEISRLKQRIKELEHAEKRHKKVEDTNHLSNVGHVDITKRKQIERELWKQYELQRVLLAAIPAYVYVKDAHSVYLLGNKQFSELSGIPENEIPGKVDYDFFSEADANCFRKDDAGIIASGKAKMDYEVKGTDAKGNTIWYSTSKIPFFDPEGKVAGLVGICINITQRKQMENTLQESEERYRSLFETSKDSIFIVNRKEGKFVSANDAACRLYGYTKDEFLQMSLSEISAEPEKTKKAVHDSITHVPLRLHRRKDGTLFPVEIEGGYFIQDGCSLHTAFIRDVTERHQIESALRASEKKFRLLVENSHDIIYSIAADGTFIFVSPAWTNQLGHPVTQVIGKSFQRFVHPDDISECLSFLTSVIETGQQLDGIEYRVKHTNGTWYWHTSSAVPFQDETGKVVGFYGIARDITERKRMLEELGRYQKHLENLVKVRTEELENRNVTLQELNAALRVLLKQREDDKKEMEDRFITNLQNMVLPFIKHMKSGTIDDRQRSYLDVIETHLNDIATHLLKNIKHFNLTPTETKVAAFVKQGMPTKEISNIMGISAGSIDVHRKHIREKLKLKNRRVNLTSYLESLEQ